MAYLQLRQQLGGIRFLVLISLLLASVTQVAAQPGPCHLYTFGSAPTPFNAGFGVPWNVFNPSELLLQAWCTNTTITAYIGPATYVYHQGYAWTGSAWQLIDLTCTGGALVSNAWCPTSTQVTLPNSSTYYAAYTCNWMNNRWYCGCRDQACTQNFWQLQSFQATTPSTTTLVGTWTGPWQSFIVGRGGGTLTLTIASENQLGQTGGFQWTGTLTRTGPGRSNIAAMPVRGDADFCRGESLCLGNSFLFSGTPAGEVSGCEAGFAAGESTGAHVSLTRVEGGTYTISSLCQSLDFDTLYFPLS